jgi:hypothetical protein
MKLQILEKRQNPDQSETYLIQVPRENVIHFGSILESLEGWVHYTTSDKKESILTVEVIKDYRVKFAELLGMIQENFLKE